MQNNAEKQKCSLSCILLYIVNRSLHLVSMSFVVRGDKNVPTVMQDIENN